MRRAAPVILSEAKDLKIRGGRRSRVRLRILRSFASLRMTGELQVRCVDVAKSRDEQRAELRLFTVESREKLCAA